MSHYAGYALFLVPRCRGGSCGLSGPSACAGSARLTHGSYSVGAAKTGYNDILRPLKYFSCKPDGASNDQRVHGWVSGEFTQMGQMITDWFMRQALPCGCAHGQRILTGPCIFNARLYVHSKYLWNHRVPVYLFTANRCFKTIVTSSLPWNAIARLHLTIHAAISEVKGWFCHLPFHRSSKKRPLRVTPYQLWASLPCQHTFLLRKDERETHCSSQSKTWRTLHHQKYTPHKLSFG